MFFWFITGYLCIGILTQLYNHWSFNRLKKTPLKDRERKTVDEVCQLWIKNYYWGFIQCVFLWPITIVKFAKTYFIIKAQRKIWEGFFHSEEFKKELERATKDKNLTNKLFDELGRQGRIDDIDDKDLFENKPEYKEKTPEIIQKIWPQLTNIERMIVILTIS